MDGRCSEEGVFALNVRLYLLMVMPASLARAGDDRHVDDDDDDNDDVDGDDDDVNMAGAAPRSTGAVKHLPTSCG